MKKITAAPIVLWLACPALAAPPPAPSPHVMPDYRLPHSSIKVTVGLSLSKCSPSIQAEPSVTMIPAVAPGKDRYVIDPAAMRSWNKTRDLTIDTYANGTLKSINGGVADRTGAIITNILKTAATFVGLADESAAQRLTGCNAATLGHLARRDALKAKLAAAKADMVTATPQSSKALREHIDGIALEIANLNTGPLSLKLEKEVPIDWAGTSGQIAWSRASFAKWVTPDANSTDEAFFRLAFCIREAAATGAGCQPRPGAGAPEPRPACSDSCRNVLVFRHPVSAIATLRAAGLDFGPDAKGRELARTDVQVPQWGEYSYLPLGAGLGVSKNFALGMNEYGRVTSFTWKSNARAESLTGSAVDIAGAASTLVTNLRNEDLVDKEARIKRLETQKKLNQLEACAAVIDAGGYTCPEPPK